MKSRNKKDKLSIYILISLIIHLLLILLFPFGSLQGVAGEEGAGKRDFGFVQFVEYKPPETQQTRETSTEKEVAEEEKEDKKEQEEKVEEVEEETGEETGTVEEQQEPEQESKSKVSIEPEDTAAERETDPETPVEEETAETGDTEQVLTSEESSMEIEERQEKQEETQERPEQEAEQGEEEQQPQESETETEAEPPPPPQAGELVGLAPVPVYPKYLVSEQQSGRVELNVHVDTGGNVEDVEIVSSSRIESMDRSARMTIERGWEFQSYQKPYYINVEVIYKIDDSGNSEVEVNLNNVTFK